MLAVIPGPDFIGERLWLSPGTELSDLTTLFGKKSWTSHRRAKEATMEWVQPHGKMVIRISHNLPRVNGR